MNERKEYLSHFDHFSNEIQSMFPAVYRSSHTNFYENVEYELTTMHEEGIRNYKIMHKSIFEIETHEKALIVTSIDIHTNTSSMEEVKTQIFNKRRFFCQSSQ